MQIQSDFWNQVDKTLTLHREHILTNEQRHLIAGEEQKAYEANLETIRKIIEEYQESLNLRNFWTELQLDAKGFRFRFNTQGYYGPGGFSSQFHIAGPLVLGIINPKGDAVQSFYNNNLEENTQIGCNFNENDFRKFVEQVISDFISPRNLIISKDQYDYLRNFNANT